MQVKYDWSVVVMFISKLFFYIFLLVFPVYMTVYTGNYWWLSMWIWIFVFKWK